MWKIPRKIIITSGVGEGGTALNAFDKALLDAGIGDLNLIRVTSVVPARARILRLKETGPLQIAPGTLVPAVYTFITSDNIGKTIGSAIAVGKPFVSERSGMIFEVSLVGSLDAARDIAERMVRESFQARGLEVGSITTEGSELVVSNGIGCVLSVVLMLP
jgi:arginine decarboxylase